MENENVDMENELGRRIAKCRREQHLTQEELAGRLGVTPQALSQYERGLRLPDAMILRALSRSLNISADELLGIEEKRLSEEGNSQIDRDIWRRLRETLDPLQIVFGEALVPLFTGSHEYIRQIGTLRQSLADDGFLMPVVRIMDQLRLKPREVMILSHHVVLERKILPEGVSSADVVKLLEAAVRSHYDEIITVSNEDAFAYGKLVGKKEGVLVGISSGAALRAAVELAKRDENAGKTIVVLLPDTGDRYLSTPLFAD